MKVDIDQFIKLTAALREIEKTPLHLLQLYKDGERVVISDEFIEEWSNIGIDGLSVAFAIEIIIGRM